MKRALALLAVFGVLAFGAAPFPGFSGKWDTTVCILPDTSLTSALTLTTNVAGFDVSGYFRFTALGLDRVSFTTSGALGPFSLKSGMYFKPSVPEYMGSYLSSSWTSPASALLLMSITGTRTITLVSLPGLAGRS